MKKLALPLLVIILISAAFSCTMPANEYSIAVAAAIGLTQTAAAIPPTEIQPSEPTQTLTATATPTPVPTATSIATGTISGYVHLNAPPTPHLIVIAIDRATGALAAADIQANQLSDSAFTLSVTPGTYEIYATSESNCYVGYTKDNLSLATLTVTAGQTQTGIVLSPIGITGCGAVVNVQAIPSFFNSLFPWNRPAPDTPDSHRRPPPQGEGQPPAPREMPDGSQPPPPAGQPGSMPPPPTPEE